MLNTPRYDQLLRCLAVIFSLALPLSANADSLTVTAEKSTVEDLVKQLQSGGLVIFLRHSTTDRSQVDQDRNNLGNCLSQRNLSVTGREQARSIGEAIRKHNIPVGAVITSPYCRCRDTAELAFGTSRVTEELRFGMGDDVQQTTRLSQALQTMLSTPPEPGTNTVLVSHTANLKEAAGIWPKPEGAAYVFRPVPGQAFEYLGRIPPDAWLADIPAPATTTFSLK